MKKSPLQKVTPFHWISPNYGETISGLPRKQRFERNRRLALGFVDGLRRKKALKYFDAIVLLGSSVKPRRASLGTDVDLVVFTKDGLTEKEAETAHDALYCHLREFIAQNEVSFESPGAIPSPTLKDRQTATMREITQKAQLILHAAKNSNYLKVRRDFRKWLT